MSQNPTIPPVPKKPPPKPNKIPPVTETIGVHKHYVDPFRGINQLHPVMPPARHASPSETDLDVVRHDEQLKGLERRVGSLETMTNSIDHKLDKVIEIQHQEIVSRKLSEAAKDEVKTLADQKTKRFQALLIAIPLILSPILGFWGSYMSKPTPDYKTNVVVVSEYTEDAAKCLKEQKTRESYELCIRTAQLKNTPNFEK